MAIVFIKQKKRQSALIIIFLFIIIITVFVLWRGFFEKQTSVFLEEVFSAPPREIKINFEILEKTKEFQPFIEIEPLEEVMGRENPFLPY